MLYFPPRARESSPRRFAFRSSPTLRYGLGSIAWIGDSSSSWSSLSKSKMRKNEDWKERAKSNKYRIIHTPRCDYYNVTALSKQPITMCHVSNAIEAVRRETKPAWFKFSLSEICIIPFRIFVLFSVNTSILLKYNVS